MLDASAQRRQEVLVCLACMAQQWVEDENPLLNPRSMSDLQGGGLSLKSAEFILFF